MATSSGIFSQAEFYGRNILKLAPDAFITVNRGTNMKYIAPTNLDTRTGTTDIRGGVVSINVSAAVSPPGSTRANITIMAPVYKGLQDDYFVTLPNGTRVCLFLPMMEIKIYMKGFYLVKGQPTYYPVFWGMITEISEDYNDGATTLSLTCSDLLSWWKYQSLTLVPAVSSSMYSTAVANKYPTVFMNMNPWQIIYNLFIDTNFASKDGGTYNMIYPVVSNSFQAPDLGAKNEEIQKLYAGFATSALDYWKKRFGFGMGTSQDQADRIPFEMFGISSGRVNLNKGSVQKYLTYDPAAQYGSTDTASVRSDFGLDFDLLSKIQPYGALNLYGTGSEPLQHTKLEIAAEICNQSQMEFYADTNGAIVFKPPFYNLDVTSGGDASKQYTIKPQDITGLNLNLNTNEICTYLAAYAPSYYALPNIDVNGYHIDWDLVKKFGIRYQKVNLRYGNSAKILRLYAAAEMSKMNGRAYQGSVSMPLRPEIRLGYPVYLSHLDTYYYVTGINHSFTFGSAATTTLSLEYRRERIFDPTGEFTKVVGGVMKGYIYRFKNDFNATSESLKKLEDMGLDNTEATQQSIKDQNNKSAESLENNRPPQDGSAASANTQAIRDNDGSKEKILRDAGLISGPSSAGFYSIEKVEPSSQGPATNRDTGGPTTVMANELVMVTDNTSPYTDINGYRHIGGFPYGSTLRLGTDLTESSEADAVVEAVVGAKAEANENVLDIPDATQPQVGPTIGSTQPSSEPPQPEQMGSAEQFEKSQALKYNNAPIRPPGSTSNDNPYGLKTVIKSNNDNVAVFRDAKP